MNVGVYNVEEVNISPYILLLFNVKNMNQRSLKHKSHKSFGSFKKE